MSNTFDVDPDTRRLAEQKAQRRLELRNEFLKLKTDPFAHASGTAGTVFDSKYIRIQALQSNYYEHFKPTGKMVFRGITFMVLPMVLLYTFVKNDRDKLERSFRNGEVAYIDRQFKFR